MGKWELWTEDIKDAPPIPKVLQYLLVLLSSQLFMYFQLLPFSFYIPMDDLYLEMHDLSLEFVITTELKLRFLHNVDIS